MADSKPADPKEGDSFFRKVARFVVNPTTDWSEINSRQDDPEGELAKAELRAMVERKRRNDFVRKRELDMLRRIRREGLSPEQLAALGSASASRIDDSERNGDPNSKIDLGVKAKIDEIEQQMVGESFATTQAVHSPSGFFETRTRPAAFSTVSPSLPAAADASGSELPSAGKAQWLAAPSPPAAAAKTAAASARLDAAPMRLSDIPTLDQPLSLTLAESAPPVEVQELVHDPELDEVVIAFANADYDTSERVLTDLIRPGGSRNMHGETWLVLFDHYRATGAQGKFEALALEYAQQFGLSAPQWFSMPKLVAESTRQTRTPMAKAGQISWSAPAVLTADNVALLQRRSETLPMPWVFDWSLLERVDIDAALQLRQLFRMWAPQQIDQRWIGGEHLLVQLKALTPVGERDIDAALWMLRMEALRLANRPDQFDETAIDYCMTYEVSPPSWERAKCRIRIGTPGQSTTGQAPITMSPSEAHTSFLDTSVSDPATATAQVELTGQLSGDIADTLSRLSGEAGGASLIQVSCAKLIRLDFMAAGDLLNWVLSCRSENRSVVFTEAHRLVALFFGAMGINEHARVKVRVN